MQERHREEVRSFMFRYTSDYIEGRDPTEIYGAYLRSLFDPEGHEIEGKLVLTFEYNDPIPHPAEE